MAYNVYEWNDDSTPIVEVTRFNIDRYSIRFRGPARFVSQFKDNPILRVRWRFIDKEGKSNFRAKLKIQLLDPTYPQHIHEFETSWNNGRVLLRNPRQCDDFFDLRPYELKSESVFTQFRISVNYFIHDQMAKDNSGDYYSYEHWTGWERKDYTWEIPRPKMDWSKIDWKKITKIPFRKNLSPIKPI